MRQAMRFFTMSGRESASLFAGMIFTLSLSESV
jgi:hypothetical protein